MKSCTKSNSALADSCLKLKFHLFYFVHKPLMCQFYFTGVPPFKTKILSLTSAEGKHISALICRFPLNQEC